MSKTNDGGPAFPCEVFGPVSITYGKDGVPYENHGNKKMSGMSLRDWFAGKAMQAYLTNSHYVDNADDENIAGWSYDTADAMLKAREETR